MAFCKVNIPKTCGEHRPHKMTQYARGKDRLYAQGKEQ